MALIGLQFHWICKKCAETFLNHFQRSSSHSTTGHIFTVSHVTPSHCRQNARPHQRRCGDGRNTSPQRHKGKVGHGRRNPNFPQGQQVLFHVALIFFQARHEIGFLFHDQFFCTVKGGEIHERVMHTLIEKHLCARFKHAPKILDLLTPRLARKSLGRREDSTKEGHVNGVLDAAQVNKAKGGKRRVALPIDVFPFLLFHYFLNQQIRK
mmetsp:Transcript_11893/g.32979  ORF Transcript_11893/g.32979 Transcript_11893/m.32979 type:complete len:209 (-) Transcript_11893:141-767(-)